MPVLIMIILFIVGIPLVILGGTSIFVFDKVKQVEDFIHDFENPEAAYQEYLHELAMKEAAATWTPLEIILIIAIVALIAVIGFVGWRLSKNQEGFEY